MSLVFQRIRSFLGLSKMNAEADEYFQIFDPGKEYVDYDASYQDNQDFSGKQTDVKMLAYYLPQYHTFKENDE